MRTKSLCTSCEQYVYTDTYHSCYDAKALRALRDAEAAVVDAALAEREAMALVIGDPGDADKEQAWSKAHDVYDAAVRALRVARQGEG
jgi:hypothetical protein